MTWLLIITIGRAALLASGPPDLGLSVGPSGQLLARVQPVAQWLGAATSWAPADKRLTLTLDQTTMQIWVSRSTAEVNGTATPLSDRPQIVEGHAVAPLRPIVEAFGGRVEYRAAEGVIVVRGRGGELRAKVPQAVVTEAVPVYHAGYPPDPRRRAAWVCLEQFLYALRDGRTADAEARCTAGFVSDYGGRLLRPMRPLRLEVFGLEGWQDAPRGDVCIRVSLHTRDATSRATQRYDFRLSEQPDWRLVSAVKC